MQIDPRTATPCRTVAFSEDGRLLAEANYLGFVTLRDAETGDVLRRFLAQTALVETARFEAGTGMLLLVGAGFEGGRDVGVVKVIDPRTGARVRELRAHVDDATDVMSLPGTGRRIVSVGLDRRVVVSDLDDARGGWAWTGYEDYLNTCTARPGRPGQIAVAGDSPHTVVLDVDRSEIVARLDTPGDTNGLLWSDDGRYLVVGDDAGRLLYFDGEASWKLVGEERVGGAAKRMVEDPGAPRRALVACYDGRVWSVPRVPGGSPPSVAIDRRRGMWGINVAATRTRVSVPTFFDRAYLLERDARGAVLGDVGREPGPTFGCNAVAVHPTRDEIAVTRDDGRVRLVDAATGRRLKIFGPDTESLLMGASWHPGGRWLATVDFYGEAFVYDGDTGRVAWRRVMGFGPGICVDHDPSGRWLAVGGYAWEARVLALGDDGLPSTAQTLDAGARGVVKSVAFAGSDRLLVASGDGALVVYDRRGERFEHARTIRGAPPMELSNGVVASPDGRTAYVVSRDQSVRAFDLGTGQPAGMGLAHVRGVKTVAISECGRHLVTGSYDRTVMIWDAASLSVRLPPSRLANSGISSVRWRGGRVYACSFDGVVTCIDGATGRLLWHRTAADAAEDV